MDIPAEQNPFLTNGMERPKADKGSLRFRRIQTCILIAGLSVFAQLYIFQPLLSALCTDFNISPATSSLSVSMSTIGMAAGLLFFAFKADAISRKTLMGTAMVLSSILTICSALSPSFTFLVGISFLKGLALSGVPAVALAYLSEELSESVIGLSISLYLSGNTIGGMSGRVIATLLAGWTNWRWATLSLGLVCLIAGWVFIHRIPTSKHFEPKPVVLKEKILRMRGFLCSPLFISMYFIAALVMGVFVSVYNYIGFILEAEPFNIPHYLMAGIFGMYSIGVFGSIIMGKLSNRYSSISLLHVAISLLLAGLLFMQWINLASIILGLCLVTFAFFCTHTLASRVVSTQAKEAKSSATSLYLLFYYMGSSLGGWLTGLVLAKWGWHYFILTLLIMGLIALLLSYWARKGINTRLSK